MPDLTSNQIQLIRKILDEHVPECQVWIFGSRALGRAKKHSDLDLALIGRDKISSHLLSSLKEEFSKSDLPFRVDLVDWNRISPLFREVIQREHVLF